MILAIDASNIRAGGTVTHLTEVLRSADPLRHGFSKVLVWANSDLLQRLDDRQWLHKMADPLLEQADNPFIDRRLLHRVYWQRFRLRHLLAVNKADLLWVPGGVDSSGFRPVVAMSQNSLPFDIPQIQRYGYSLGAYRLRLLRIAQSRTFLQSDGVIFVTEYARSTISQAIGLDPKKTIVINHGSSAQFLRAPRVQRALSEYTFSRPLKLLYVSTIDVYKNQECLSKAIAHLRFKGIPVCLELVGAALKGPFHQLNKTLNAVDPRRDFIRYTGPISYEKMHDKFVESDINVFASSSEVFGLSLIEAMSAGLPIACSNRSAMPELLGDAGVYFDPESSASTAFELHKFISSPMLRASKADMAFRRAQQFSWVKCAEQTFRYLATCVRSRQG